MSNTRLISTIRKLARIDLLLMIACAIIFLIWPELDLAVAANYYADGKFIFADNAFIRFIYLLFAKIHIAYLLGFIIAIIICTRKQWLHSRKKWTFLLIALLLAPGLLVNTILKDNSLGRPRPQHIEEFGGKDQFTPVFYYSGACKKNCSFVSGHAAIGFYLMAVAWVRQRRIWLFYGVILGSLVGFVRIVQGGHFLSDVIFAGWFTYFTYLLLAKAMSMQLTPASTEPTQK
ncbi:Membrane-associated enzyme, PAP2 (acid phosphatase) superfamily [Alteromonadaceae bacterium Bs31]|nr:Membrane-associated enzyme, PAP2 (acid phosphatase) superfamily [Alteromonadaceae bacterium Bs31]